MPKLLPYRPKPKPDELFSSWLIRISNGYRMEFAEFMDLLGLCSHLPAGDIDRLASSALLVAISEATGTGTKAVRQMLLQHRLRALDTDKVNIDSAGWPWYMPIGSSRRNGRIIGFQVCPACLREDEGQYFTWRSCVALYCCCTVHGTMLIDRCPECLSAIHASAQGLLGLRRVRTGTLIIELERCTHCRFDLRTAPTSVAPARLHLAQCTIDARIAIDKKGTDSSEHFAILRHLVTLLYGENRGLEALRRIVAQRSEVKRVDVPVEDEPYQELIPFEETAVELRAEVLVAAFWLIEDWPARFIACCREAEVQNPQLKQGALRVQSFLEAAWAAYPTPQEVRRKPPRSVPAVYTQKQKAQEKS